MTLLNKEKSIWECLNSNCGQKFLYYPDLNRFMTLDGEDFEPSKIPITGKLQTVIEEESIVEDKVKETKPKSKEKVAETTEPIDAMLKNFDFT